MIKGRQTFFSWDLFLVITIKLLQWQITESNKTLVSNLCKYLIID